MASNKPAKPSKLSGINSPLFAIVAEGFFSRLSFGFISFALPLYAYHLGLSVLQIGFLMTLNEATALVFKPMMGWVADRYGLKRIYTASIGLRSCVALLLALTPSPWQLYGIKALHGMSKAMRGPSSSALIAEQGKKKIASAFAWYHTAKIVAGSLGKALAGLILTLSVSNFSLVFTISFLLSALPLYTVARYVKNNRPSKKEREIPVKKIIAEEGIPHVETKTKPVILPFTILTFLIHGTAEMLRGLFPILATQYGGLNEAQTGSIYMASTVAVLIAGPLFGWLSDRGNRELVLLVRSLGNTMSSLIYIFAPSFHGIATGKLVDDMGKASFRPAWGSLMAHVSDFDRSRRAQIMSWMLVGEDAGKIVGPLLAGLLWNTWGLSVMLGGRVLLSIITEVYVIILNRSLEKKERDKKKLQLEKIPMK